MKEFSNESSNERAASGVKLKWGKCARVCVCQLGAVLLHFAPSGGEQGRTHLSQYQPGITARGEHVTIYHAGRREEDTISSLQT